jgi:tetratricopeptide (TPR) repeat protein
MTDNLPDYYEALAGAIERLARNDRASRGALYDRARRLLLEEAQSADPPWQLVEIVREQRALEEAIDKVETRYGTQPKAPARPKAPPPVRPRRLPPPPLPQEELYEPEHEDVEESVREEPESFDTEGYETDAPRLPVRQSRQRPPRSAPSTRLRDEPPARAVYPWWLWALIGGLTLLVIVLLVLLLRPGPSAVADAPEPAISGVVKEDTKKVDAAAAREVRERRERELIARGNELGRNQDFAGAATAYSEAIRLGGPVNASVYNNRAFAYWSRGMTEEAIADYDEAIRLEPNNIVALTNRAVAYNFLGNYDAAIRDLDRALALKPDSAEVLNSRCWGRALAGHTQAAVADCNEALKLRPDDPNTLDSRGFAFLKMGETDRAIADYTAALKLVPKLAGALYGRGIAKLRKGDKKGGDTDIAAAKAMRPEIEAIFARYGVR